MLRRRTLVAVAGIVAIVASSWADAARGKPTIGEALCPNPHGGHCLGKLETGTHSTTLFQPKITYAVPVGWSNFEDLPGNFLLVPPWGEFAGVNRGTSDYIGIYTSIAAHAPGCEPGRARTVGRAPIAIARWIEQSGGLDATTASPVAIGGLRGLVLD